MGLATENEQEEVRLTERASRKQPILNEYNAYPGSTSRTVVEDLPAQDSEYFAHLARATNDAVRDWNVNDGSIFWPQGLEQLFGYADTGPQTPLGLWQDRVHPADRARLGLSIAEAIASPNEHWSGEYRFRHHNGTYLQVLERALILRDQTGQAQRWIGSLMDISARQKLQDQLCRSQKMEAFGQLASGVAHDFNNFLTTILGYSDMVLAEDGMSGEVESHIQEIRSAAGRASDLAGHLLAFSRKQMLAPHVIDVNEFLHNLERTILRLLGENIRVISDFDRSGSGLHVRVDPGQLTQIILNLALNARDAMGQSGRLTLATSAVHVCQENSLISELEPLPPGEYIVISVVDTGHGLTEEARKHLFEPFFTTKEGSNNSGLGLATSYGIVRQSGGSIQIESAPEEGTRVHIYLPRVPAPPPPSYRKPSSRKLPTGTESILVLEDDISVRHMSVRILRSLGYEVTEAATGDHAQRLFGGEKNKDVDLLLTDIVMPDMSGRFFADWLRNISPRTRVVFVSGYLQDSLHPGDRLENGVFFLPKPFDPEQLAQTVRQALDA